MRLGSRSPARRFVRQDRPRLLVLSHVIPVPPRSGQQQRVYYTLRAARKRFHVTFVGVAPKAGAVKGEVSALCDRALFLSDGYAANPLLHVWNRGIATAYALRTGLKRSNYTIGQLQFAPDRVRSLIGNRDFDCVLFEYWHAVDTVGVFRERGIPCVLDMHDILWHSRERQLRETRLPHTWRRWELERYKKREERAWNEFDALVAINREEERYVQRLLPSRIPVFHAAMGTDLTVWPYSWGPSEPPRLAYYAGLGSPHNQQAAFLCAERIMPLVWRTHPETELWLVGSDPPESLRRLAVDPRIKVTGYLERPQDILKTMTAVLCPWTGKYGFRSRLVEVMALGVPTLATPDAVWGMELESGRGLLLGEHPESLAGHATALLADPAGAKRHSLLARQQVEAAFGLPNTYDRLILELDDWLAGRKAAVS